MSIIGQLRTLLRLSRDTVVDNHTRQLLVAELKTRIRKDQSELRDEVVALLQRASQSDITSIQPILKRCYLQGKYKEQKLIRNFLTSKVSIWPHESVLSVLKNYNQSLEAMAKSPKRRESIKLPLREERQIPSIASLMGVPDNTKVIEPLPIEGKLFIEKDEKLNSMLQSVLKLYTFITSTSFIHSRHFQSPVLSIPVTVLGEDIAECRKRNLVKKKISYIRNVLTSVPPLELKDSNYLDAYLDSLYQDKAPTKLKHKIRREYKKFMRRTYTIDTNFNIKTNKNAYLKAQEVERDDFF